MAIRGDLFQKFIRSEKGSIAPLFVILLVPIITAIGLSIDYTSATTTRASMQSALDAAILSITTLPRDTTKEAREQKLRDAFASNGGQGTATLGTYTIEADGSSVGNATATYDMPTGFMKIANVDKVALGVASAVNKTSSLVETTFRIDKVSGWWNKTVTLYGTKIGETNAQKLMQIVYTYNGGGDAKGYGTTIVSKVDGTNTNGTPKFKETQRQTCTTKAKSTYGSSNPIPAGAIIDNANQKVTVCVMDPVSGGGAVIDVAQMNTLYLQMDVPSGNPTVMKSNDPATSNRLYLDEVEVASGKSVDIFTAVPCGGVSKQAWEDGGSAVPAPVVNADFAYIVNGKCDFTQRPSTTSLTE